MHYKFAMTYGPLIFFTDSRDEFSSSRGIRIYSSIEKDDFVTNQTDRTDRQDRTGQTDVIEHGGERDGG